MTIKLSFKYDDSFTEFFLEHLTEYDIVSFIALMPPTHFESNKLTLNALKAIYSIIST